MLTHGSLICWRFLTWLIFFYCVTLPRIIEQFKNVVIVGSCNVLCHSSQNWYFPIYYESATQTAFHSGEVILQKGKFNSQFHRQLISQFVRWIARSVKFVTHLLKALFYQTTPKPFQFSLESYKSRTFRLCTGWKMRFICVFY